MIKLDLLLQQKQEVELELLNDPDLDGKRKLKKILENTDLLIQNHPDYLDSTKNTFKKRIKNRTILIKLKLRGYVTKLSNTKQRMEDRFGKFRIYLDKHLRR